MKNTSWKTTLCGVIAAAATGIANANISPVLTKICGMIAMLATAGIGFFARDNDKSSEDVAQK